MGLPAYRDATLAANGDQMTKVRAFSEGTTQADPVPDPKVLS